MTTEPIRVDDLAQLWLKLWFAMLARGDEPKAYQWGPSFQELLLELPGSGDDRPSGVMEFQIAQTDDPEPQPAHHLVFIHYHDQTVRLDSFAGQRLEMKLSFADGRVSTTLDERAPVEDAGSPLADPWRTVRTLMQAWLAQVEPVATGEVAP